MFVSVSSMWKLQNVWLNILWVTTIWQCSCPYGDTSTSWGTTWNPIWPKVLGHDSNKSRLQTHDVLMLWMMPLWSWISYLQRHYEQKHTLLALNQAKFDNLKFLSPYFCDGFLVVSVLGFLLAIGNFIFRPFFWSFLGWIGLGTIVEALQKTNIWTFMDNSWDSRKFRWCPSCFVL
jgi:hypothetical protein